ncbi:hypothetical protein [Campylobacter devanensis]|uniref:hypothetical protein n=1 Tax=Campylobacter devanensis TaxID=3161138 RepID=UPI0015D88781|nr:hypothetical protein [Campylobacter sp. P0139]
MRILGRAINRFKLITLSSMTAIWYGAKLPKPFLRIVLPSVLLPLPHSPVSATISRGFSFNV